MTTFAASIRLCGLSQQEAAEFLGVRVDTIKSWSAGRNPVPQGVWQMLADLWRRIEDAADNAAASIETDGLDPRALQNVSANDEDGLPGGAVDAAGAMALLIALADDDNSKCDTTTQQTPPAST